ncbi:MAG: carbamoyl phosphate synthase small subunit, partial [Desulfatirhabdiaceae bacterium]|nr:carbamoyl phosphate synthase small subunit [Desulfatirhabdiaceae bacterium]
MMGVDGLDTRALTMHIRKAGAMRAFISTIDLDPLSCVIRAQAFPAMLGLDLTGSASTKKAYRWLNGQKAPVVTAGDCLCERIWRFKGTKPTVAVFV